MQLKNVILEKGYMPETLIHTDGYRRGIYYITRRNMEVEPEIALPFGKRIVTMSQLAEQKGFDLLIKVFARVYKSYWNWNSIIIGTGQLFDEISQKAKQLGVDKVVYFPCRVKNPSILFVI
jgi:glycosyltransferase involved in cell wall biosynthesis|tara:strand:+ start:167 stop:529 length:363 start_codon:yes stop_codon:yes gene_type:complete